VYNLNSK